MSNDICDVKKNVTQDTEDRLEVSKSMNSFVEHLRAVEEMDDTFNLNNECNQTI